MSGRVPLTLACWDYDRTAALASGEVRPDGVGLTCLTAASRDMLPWLYAEAERTRDLMGPSWWSYGLAGNEVGLAAFLRYSREQGLARRPLAPAELFAPETLESYVI